MRTTTLAEVTILGHRQDQQNTIKKLHELGMLHITQASSKEQKFTKSDVTQGLDDISRQLIQLRYIAEQSKLTYENYPLNTLPPYHELSYEAETFIEKYLPVVEEKSEEKKTLKERRDRLLTEQKLLEELPITIVQAPKGKEHRLYYAEKSILFPKLRKKIRFVLQKTKKEHGYYYLFTANETSIEQLKETLRQTPLKKIDITFLKNSSSEEKLQELIEELQKTEKSFAKAHQELYEKLNLERVKLPYLITTLENYREEHLIASKFLATKNFFILKGYTEPKNIETIKKHLTNTTITITKAGNEAPTKLKEKGINKHFQAITELFSLPKYGAVDPTPLVAFFYPFFFGFMLSDIGYGLLLLIAIGGMRFTYGKKMQTPYVIFGLSALSSILFGLLFGSFFGNLIPVQPLLTDSFSASYDILKAALIIGLIHLNLGAALNIYQYKIKGAPIKEILIKTSGFFLLELTAITAITGTYWLAGIFGALLLYILIKEKGPFGIMDITGFFGTWFSYARLLALSLATAGVALAINIIAQKALALGKIGVLLWLIILIAGHLFNFALNILGCTIHAARLHYVEFFSFFFEGEGKKYQPFTLKKTMEA